MDSLLKDLMLLAARRNEKARAALRAVNQTRHLARKGRKIVREIRKLGGP